LFVARDVIAVSMRVSNNQPPALTGQQRLHGLSRVHIPGAGIEQQGAFTSEKQE
jgi:hypothetical protein